MCTPQLLQAGAAAVNPATAAVAAAAPALIPQAPVAPGAGGGASTPPASKAAATPQESRAPAAMAGRAGGALRDPTLLTGPGGVAPNLLTIGKSSLLGQ